MDQAAKKIEKNFKKLLKAHKTYKENFLNREIIYIYEEAGELKEFSIKFLKGNFLHLTGIKFTEEDRRERPNEVSAKRFFKNLEENRIELKKENFDNFTYIKLNKLHEISGLLYNQSYIYKTATNNKKIVSLKVDNLITQNNKKEKCPILGIEEKTKGNYIPKSFLDAIPEDKGIYLGKVLVVGYKEITANKDKKFEIVFGNENLEKLTDELKYKFNLFKSKELESLIKEIIEKEVSKDNYNVLTGNPIIAENHLSGDKRWIAVSDVRKENISVKESEKPMLSVVLHKEEERLYAKPIEYYNISQLNITKEIEQKFVPIKEKKKIVEKDKGIER